MCQIIAIGLENSKSQSDRRAVLAGDVLTLTHGRDRKDVASYRVSEHIHVPFPARGFHLAKLAGGTDAEAENYDVLIDPTTHSTCECKGHYRHGRCKHVDALVELLAEGAFAADEVQDDLPDEPWPSQEQLEYDAQFDVPPYAVPAVCNADLQGGW